MGPCLRAQRHPVQAGDGSAQWHADHLGPAKSRSRNRGQHPASDESTDPVCQPGAGVCLVHDDRHSRRSARRQIGRHGDVSAEAHHHIRVCVIEHGPGLPDGCSDPPRQSDQVAVELARQRHRGDESQLIAALGNQPLLQASSGAKGRDTDAGVQRDQGVGHGQRGFDVPGGAAAGNNDRQDFALGCTPGAAPAT